MSKEAYYFSHDSNARNDDKIIAMRMKHGMEGYGIYWGIVERLRESAEYTGVIDYNVIAYDLRVSAEKIKSIIEDYSLFEIDKDEKIFTSNSLQRRMQHADELRGKYSEIAKKRWDKPGARKTLEERRDMPQCYILYCFNDREEFIKVGITTTTVSRRYSKGMGSYKFEVLIQFFSNSYIDIESQISSILSENRYKPHKKFPGYLECYTVDSLDLVKDFNQSDISERCVADALQMRCDAVKERKRKENESKGNDLDDAGAHAHTQEDIDAFEKFQKWILRNAPSVMKMVQPFKIEEYLSIRDNIPPDKVSDLLQRMDNRKDLLKNNKSAYRTLLNWSKNEWNKPATNIASTTAGLKQL